MARDLCEVSGGLPAAVSEGERRAKGPGMPPGRRAPPELGQTSPVALGDSAACLRVVITWALRGRLLRRTPELGALAQLLAVLCQPRPGMLQETHQV